MQRLNHLKTRIISSVPRGKSLNSIASQNLNLSLKKIKRKQMEPKTKILDVRLKIKQNVDTMNALSCDFNKLIFIFCKQKTEMENVPDQNDEQEEKKKLQQILDQLNRADQVNMEAQEIYLDIVKMKKTRIDSNYIKSIYRMFSENKQNQIRFERQYANYSKVILNKDLTRIYVRLFEKGMRKIAYYWMNSNKLLFLAPSILSFSKILENSIKKILQLQTLENFAEGIRIYCKQNVLLEEKIYNLLIDLGYLASIEEYYRINGIEALNNQVFQIEPQLEEEKKIQTQKKIFDIFLPSKQEKTKNTDSRKDLWKKKQISREKETFKIKFQEEENINKKIKKVFDSYLPNLSTALKRQSEEKKKSVLKEINLSNILFNGQGNPEKNNKIIRHLEKKSSLSGLLSNSSHFISLLDSSEFLTIEKMSQILIEIDEQTKRSTFQDSKKLNPKIKRRFGIKTSQNKTLSNLIAMRSRNEDFDDKVFLNIKKEQKKSLLSRVNALKHFFMEKDKRQVQNTFCTHGMDRRVFENQAILKELGFRRQNSSFSHQILFIDPSIEKAQSSKKIKISQKIPRQRKTEKSIEKRPLQKTSLYKETQKGTRYVIYDRRRRNIIEP